MTSQLDLFGDPGGLPPLPLASAAPAPPRRPAAPVTLEGLLPRRCIPWANRLSDVVGALPLELMISAAWTGVVLEVLSLPTGRLFLHRDGQIQSGIPADPTQYRRVFVRAAEARRFADKIPLAIVGSRAFSALRLAPAETASPDLATRLDWLESREAAELRNAAEHKRKALV